MVVVQKVSRTELARNTRRVLNDVQRGRTAVIESHGQPEAAILDIIDYRILRAVMRAYATPPDIDPEAGLMASDLAPLEDANARYNLVVAHYLAGSISLARAAELLGMPVFELRTRCSRLDVPLRTAPTDADQATQDALVASNW